MPDDVATRARRFDEYVTQQARRRPDAPAVACSEFRWSYAVLEHRVEAYARAFLAHGVAPGEVVAVLGNSRPECLLAFLACCRVGAVYLGLNPKYAVRELALVLGDAQPRLILVMGEGDDLGSALDEGGQKAHVVRRGGISTEGAVALDDFLAAEHRSAPQELRRPSPSGPCAVVYTSGSTGTPKGALLSHNAIARSAMLTFEHWYGGASDIRTVAQHPINHVAWLVCECAAVLLGGGMLFFRERFDGGATLRLIADERLNLWIAFPSMVALAMESEEFERCDLSSLRRVAFGSQPRIDMLRRLRARTPAICSVSYGLTEASGGALIATRDEDDLETVATSIGRALPGVDVRVVDADGRDVPAGEPGELLIRDESVFLGYLNRPEALAEALDDEGWLRTGDAVAQDPDGVFRMVGRLKEMFKSGGYNVFPAEVESVIGSHAAVSEVVVVEAPDPLWTEVGVAFVVLLQGASADLRDLHHHARSRLANYKIPKCFLIVDELPRLPNGKPDKALLRQQARHLAESHSVA